MMKTVVLEVRSLAETLADASQAMNTGRAEASARIAFATPELLWRVLTAKRVLIREAARRVGRDGGRAAASSSDNK
jgi:hypothetical protein